MPSLSNKPCHEKLQGFFALDVIRLSYYEVLSCSKSLGRYLGVYRRAFYLDGGTKSFIGRLVSSLFSIAIRRLTPSITFWTSSTSEKPSLSKLEMSKTLPSAAVSTPPVGSIDYIDKHLFFKLCYKESLLFLRHAGGDRDANKREREKWSRENCGRCLRCHLFPRICLPGVNALLDSKKTFTLGRVLRYSRLDCSN